MKERKPTKRQLEAERREQEEWRERWAREKRHSELIEQGYTLVKPEEREHPAHTEELLARIDALARYLGRDNYEPTSSHKAKRKRAHRLWTDAYKNFQAMLRDPKWWSVNARNQYPIVFPPNATPLPTSVPDAVYIKDRSVPPYQPSRWGEELYPA